MHKFEAFRVVHTAQKFVCFFGQNAEKITVQEGFLHLALNGKKPIDKFYIMVYHNTTQKSVLWFGSVRKFYLWRKYL